MGRKATAAKTDVSPVPRTDMVERTNSHKLSSDLHVCTMEHTSVPHKNKHNNFFSLKRSVSKDICMLFHTQRVQNGQSCGDKSYQCQVLSSSMRSQESPCSKEY